MKCPTCGEAMASQTVYDVRTDVCRAHGVWLDKGELQQICDAVRESRPGVDTAADRQRGRCEGIFLGWLSLLLPK